MVGEENLKKATILFPRTEKRSKKKVKEKKHAVELHKEA